MKKVVMLISMVLNLSSCQLTKSQPNPTTVGVSKAVSNQTDTVKKRDAYEYDPANPVKTVDEAVDIIMAQLEKNDIEYLKNSSEKDRYLLHFGLGMGIRNSFGLWKGNEALLKDACGGQICHPDEASSVIIEKLLTKVKNTY